MNKLELQQWLNKKIKENKLNIPLLVEDGNPGSLTRATFIQVFVNKNPARVTDQQLMELSKTLGEVGIKKIKAVAKVESGGFGWFSSGLPKILYERHFFYRFIKKALVVAGFDISNSVGGSYTLDANKNGVNDSWEKLSYAVCVDPDAACQSVSIGTFQVMGVYYKQLGYATPLDMLWAARESEYEHYKMLVGYIKMAGLVAAFRNLSTNPQSNIAFARGYNGPAYAKFDYHKKLASAMF